MRKPIVTIDPGHGGDDPGCIFRPTPEDVGYYECDVVWDIAEELRLILSERGIAVRLTHEKGCYFMNDPASHPRAHRLGWRAWLSRGSDLFISLHCNSASAIARGFEVFVNPRRDKDDLDFAEDIMNAQWACPTWGVEFQRSRGIKFDPMKILDGVHRCPAILHELGFMSSDVDNGWHPDGEMFIDSEKQKAAAQFLAKGILSNLRRRGLLPDGPILTPLAVA